MSGKPVLAISMGDPAGIGPEVVVKALAQPRVRECCRPLVVGSVAALERALAPLDLPLHVRAASNAEEAEGTLGGVTVLEAGDREAELPPLGKITAAAGQASVDALLRAVLLVQAGEAAALVTAPIHKEAWNLAGHKDLGHMDFLARLTATRDYATMLATKGLRVVHLTTHYELSEACSRVTRERVLARLRLTDRSFRAWGFDSPRIGVAALNPHAGEGGLVGRAELEQIAPAVGDALAEGIDARGPFPADSIFNRAMDGEFDAVLAMYHDQGHIPIKVYGFAESYSVALGLPFIRTSVDHGTAFDIAGKGVADATSMVEAIVAAAALAERRAQS